MVKFEESPVFELLSKVPDGIADGIIKSFNDSTLSVDDETILRDGIRDFGFYLMLAAEASLKLTHAMDQIRNHGNLGPDIRYLLLESSAQLNNAVLLREPVIGAREFIMKFGEDEKQWTSEVPPDLPDDGVDIEFVFDNKEVRKGKLMYFRFKDLNENTVITDIPTIYDPELYSYLTIANNPLWKYVNVSHTESDPIIGQIATPDGQEGIAD